MNDEAFFGEYWRGSGGLLGAGGQAVSAADCWILGRPGFPDGVGLGDTEDIDLAGIGRTPYQDSRSTGGPSRAWPDGNTSLLRLALSKLIPNAFPNVDVGDGPKRPDQLSIVKAQAVYPELDNPRNGVRVRLNSTVFNVEPCKDRKGYSPVDYVLNRVPGTDRHHGHGHGTTTATARTRAGACGRGTSSWRAGTASPRTSWTGSRRSRSRASATPARCR